MQKRHKVEFYFKIKMLKNLLSYLSRSPNVTDHILHVSDFFCLLFWLGYLYYKHTDIDWITQYNLSCALYFRMVFGQKTLVNDSINIYILGKHLISS